MTAPAAQPARLADVTALCERLTGSPGFPDYPGAANGLQIENNGLVHRIGAAVDANLPTFSQAAAAGVDFLIVHHGLFWDRPNAYTGRLRQKLRTAFDANLAVWSCHLPLDGHPRLGNNACIARHLGLESDGAWARFEDRDIGVTTRGIPRSTLRERLTATFPAGFRALEFGSDAPPRIAICSGNGTRALADLDASGADTFITGELAQHAFTEAVERRLNLYLCGHYSSEIFGVRALATEVAASLGLDWVFLDTACPL